MKSIPQMAEELNISSGTIREYLDRFNEFFPDPVEHGGVKEYPPETAELIGKIYDYYQNSGMTKEQIRVKLGGAMASETYSGEPAEPVSAPAMDTEQFNVLTEKLDKLIQVMEVLTDRLSGIGNLGAVPAGGDASNQIKSQDKIKAISDQISDIMEMNQGDDLEQIEQNVKAADGTVIFSYGRMSPGAVEAMKYCKTYKKPWIHIDLETEKRPSFAVRAWLRDSKIKALNVAGKSASRIPGLKKTVNDMIAAILNP